jgi:hypothetical protein
MDNMRAVLAGVGYGARRHEPECWQVRRLGGPAPRQRPRLNDPARSRALRFWLDRLRDRRRPSPYQICPAMPIAATEDHLGRRAR